MKYPDSGLIAQMTPIKDIELNPNNPRHIKGDKFDALVASIKSLPEMSFVRAVIINQDNMILGGNQRFQAMKEAGWKEIPTFKVDWTAAQQREFIVKDNAAFGEWDWDVLANEYSHSELEDWGVELKSFDYGDDSQEPKEKTKKEIECPECGHIFSK